MTRCLDDPGLLAALERLAALDPDERETALVAMESESPKNAHRLRRMLGRGEQAEVWFEGLETAIGLGLAAELDSAWAPGRVVGPYRLERLLATGGMDAVFLARKADGELKRPVALKLVPAGLVDDETTRRFRRERDLLAALANPNIAALLDAGVTEDGQPWFAMEYIDGERFDIWSEGADRLTFARKFCLLADAVAFAHRNLVVHGDLKPGNVMIDSDGRLRLLDFGISRLMNEIPRADAPHYFTAGFAAPEVLAGSPANTASDVYSLGVMLGEVVETRGWRRGSAGRDLAAIVSRACANSPEDRYDSARLFADDMRCWLRGEPVAARNGGTGYRLSRRIRRHPIAAFGIALAVVALIGFAIVSRVQVERFERERDKARELAAFLEQVFVSADPSIARGETLTARDLLDRGRERLETETIDSSVRVDFLSVLGRTYQRLGDYRTAGQLLDQALMPGLASANQQVELKIERAETHRLAGEFDAAISTFREVLEGAGRIDKARRARALGGLGRTLAQAGRPGEAVPLLEDSLVRTRELSAVPRDVLADRLNDTGSALFRLGRFEEAIERLDEALTLRRGLDRKAGLSNGGPRTATLVNNLGLMHYLRGNPETAEPLLREALAMRREILDKDHPDLAQTLTNLGLMLKDYGSAESAAVLLEEALEVRRATLEPGHYRIGQAILNLAIALRDSGDQDAAAPLFAQALERLIEQLGAEHPQVAVAHTELGQLYLDTGRPLEAEAAFRRSLEIRRVALGEAHPHLAWSLLGLGRSLVAAGRPAEALPLLRQAVEIRQQVLPPEDPLRILGEETLREAQRLGASD